MAVNPPDTDAERYLLPCGRDLDRLWEQLRAGRPDAHARDCPHCSTALASLSALHEATETLRTDRAEPSADLSGRIMSAVRAEVRRGELLPLPEAGFGPVEISEQAATVVLRYAADTVEGVRARRCRIRAVAGAASVWLSLAVSGDRELDELVRRVRQRVSAACTGQVGLSLGRLDVHVEDFYDL